MEASKAWWGPGEPWLKPSWGEMVSPWDLPLGLLIRLWGLSNQG
jgi:hypothetical protein